MTYHLPPLNALRAFEAAARHSSFRNAALELHVTPDAVGQHVRGVEQRLGVSLFERVHAGLLLTPAGQRYLTALRSAFATISVATDSLTGERRPITLTIAAEPELAVNWLVPRLANFHAVEKRIRVRVVDSRTKAARNPDLRILTTPSDGGESYSEGIVRERLLPAHAPGFLAQAPRGGVDTIAKSRILECGDAELWIA